MNQVPSYVEWQGKDQRKLTPMEFALHLVNEVRIATGSIRVAALFTHIRGPYARIANVDSWPIFAQAYAGPYPVVCHPPCGPWGKFKWRCKHEDKTLGILAIDHVHRWGGVVEQPLGSTLFRDHGRPGARLTRCNQQDYGHQCLKQTLLYWCL
jgi:hypothetical protein